MAQLNPEQLKACEHHGNVLLNAGAGSGKTTVLVEHVIYTLNQYQIRNSYRDDKNYREELIKFLCSIVVVTFTKKAAGEFGIRLTKKLKDQEGPFWELVFDYQNNIYTGTLHGFCNKLIAGSYFPEYNPMVEILSDMEQRNIIQAAFEEWALTIKDDQLGIEELLFAHSDQIINAYAGILNDPLLRQMWEDNQAYEKFDENDFVEKALDLQDLSQILQGVPNLPDYSSEKGKWIGLLDDFVEFYRENPISNIESLVRYYYRFEVLSIRAPKKAHLVEVADYIKLVMGFIRWIKSHGQSFAAYNEHKEVFHKWHDILKDGYQKVREKYLLNGGYSFSDLEYYVLKGIENPISLEKIFNTFKYFIVDEFQDTSEIQFSIIKKIIKEDYNRLFVVGDIKQAIYGFRGGEIGVFHSCERLVNQKLSLVKNYRSHKNIVQFNNNFFDWLSFRSFEYTGYDRFGTHVEKQVEDEKKSLGLLHRSVVEIVNDQQRKPDKYEINQLEAYYILKRIQKIREEHPNEKVAILYKSLGPSIPLISYMLEENLEFTAQVKVPNSEDPIISLFSILIDSYLLMDETKPEKSRKYFNFLFTGYLSVIGLELSLDKEQLFEDFISHFKSLGLLEAFNKFIFKCGLSNSNYPSNAKHIEEICRSAKDDPELVWELLEYGKKNIKYSIDFQNGNNPEKIIIMTTHASKGLQFDHVILGGIHTNGNQVANRDYIGKLPQSFKWKTSALVKKNYDSPQFILEKEIAKKKDFSESKRLFYVACTRAISSINWVDLILDGDGLTHSKDSWIEAFRKYPMTEDIQEERIDISLSDFSQSGRGPIQTPLFHKDTLGLVPREGADLIISSELSVTRLSLLSECPRKFFFKNICRFEEEGLDQQLSFGEEESISSAERGTHLHYLISRMIQGEPIQIKDNEQVIFEYINREILSLEGEYDLRSENKLKFPFFGQMISGTPDLILIPREDQVFKVIDFKSGKLAEDKSAYWYQLYLYGYACYWYELLPKECSIEYQLMFFDLQKSFNQTLSFQDIESKLFEMWKKVNRLDQANQDHCKSCEFQAICSH